MTGADGKGMVFVVGQRKSGSTWLLQLLSLHPQMRGVHETHAIGMAVRHADPVERTRRIFERTPWGSASLVDRLTRLGRPLLELGRGRNGSRRLPESDRPAGLIDLPRRDRRRLRRELEAIPDPGEACRHFFTSLRDQLQPPAYLVEKSPSHIFHLDHLREWFPQAKLVVIHRDGRDAVVSDHFFVKRYESRREWSLAQSAEAWRRCIELERSFVRENPMFACSYEELHRNGDEVVGRLLEFLGLSAEPAVVRDLIDRSSFEYLTGRSPGEEARGRFLRKGLPGDWRNHFTADDKRTFKQLAGAALVELGYERDDSW